MPVEINITSFKCFNQLRNAEDYTRNTGDFTENLVANVGEKVKLEIVCELFQNAYTEGVEEWEIFSFGGGTTGRFVRSSGSFLEDGIQVGDAYAFYADWVNRITDPSEFNGLVTAVSSDGRTLDFTVSGGTLSSTGTQTNVGIILDQFDVNNFNNALFVKFGLLENAEAFNYNSKVTENLQVYYNGAITTSLTDADPLGIIRDWVTGAMQINTAGVTLPEGQCRYTIVHEFVVTPFYILAYRQFLDSGAPDLFEGDSSLKYAYELEFRKQLTNTGSSKTNIFNDFEGFVGWFGENFNGLNAAYQIASVAYEDDATGDPLDAININLTTKATITIDKAGAISDYSCAVYLIRLPNSEAEYIGTETDLIENFIYKSEIVSSPDTTSANVTTSIVGGDLEIVYDINFTTAERLRLSTSDEFLLWVQIEDPTTAVGGSDRVALIADVQNFIDVDFLAGFVDVPKYNFVTHGKTIATGAPSTIVINEDGVLLDATIGVDTTKNVVINAITGVLIAYNPTTGEFFNLDSYPFNIGAPLFASGLQQIQVDTTRGYPLAGGDKFNTVSIETLGLSGDFQQFAVQLGQKIRWQDWRPNPAVDTVFFDAAEPNNNLNFKSSNYSQENDYEIRLALIVNVTGDDDLGRTITGDFVQFGGELEVRDYDETDDVTGVIETLDPATGVSLGGGVLFNGNDTLFRCTFSDAALIEYGIHRIEPSQNTGDGIFELSSVDASVNNNLLKPLEGETLLKFTKVGSVVTTECLIDGSLVQEGVNYKLSARAGNLF